MGQCVSSVHKDPDSGNKYLQTSSTGLQDFLISSPPKEKSQRVEFTKIDQISRTSSYSYGGEKEAFFDTQPWLESDCEDEFYSVNGDFTPSRGSTPVHRSFSSPEIRRSRYWNSSAGPSPNARKKSLSDLFEESGRYVTEEIILSLPDEAEIGFNFKAARDYNESLSASAISSPCILGPPRSSYSGQNTPVGNDVVRKVRSFKSVKCCLPQLLLSQSFSKRKGVSSMSPVEKNG